MLKKTCKILLMCTILLSFGYIGLFHIYLPNVISLREGSLKTFDYSLPFKATIESAEVLSINNEPVRGNITVDLSEPLTITGQGEGSARLDINAFGHTIKTVKIDVTKNIELVPCGMTVGVKIATNGVLVLGCGAVKNASGEEVRPADGVLHSGDLILSANAQTLSTKTDLISAIEESEGDGGN